MWCLSKGSVHWTALRSGGSRSGFGPPLGVVCGGKPQMNNQKRYVGVQGNGSWPARAETATLMVVVRECKCCVARGCLFSSL
jgi:hypothetical protein